MNRERIVDTEEQREQFITFVRHFKLPFTAKLEEGRHRSTEQNRTAFLWYAEIAHDSGLTIREVRAFCKWKFGVPLLSRDSEKLSNLYDRALKSMTYPEIVELLADDPAPLPVTSLMKTKQMSEYLDHVFQFFTQERGIRLTLPEAA